MPVINSINNRASGSLALPVYSIANLPSASLNPYEIAICSPCDGGNTRTIWSDGTNWRYSYSNQIVNADVQALTSALPRTYIDLSDQTSVTKGDNGHRIYSQLVNGISQLKSIDSGDFVRNIGDSYLVVFNSTGSTINKGQPLYQTGANGGVPSVGLARANARSTMPCLGLAAESIAANSAGRAIVLGILTKVDTSAFSNGSAVWVSDTVAGSLTTTEPQHPNLSQRIGSIIVGSAMGSIQVRVQFVSGENQGTIYNNFSIGDGLTGAKSIKFSNAFPSSLSWNPTSTRAIVIPDGSGTLALAENVISASRSISATGTGLTGGGDLSADRTFSLSSQLQNFAGLSIANNSLPIGNGAGTFTAIIVGSTNVRSFLAASSASNARSSISAAISGANGDITSLAGLTTPLSASQGGTGSGSYAIGDILAASATNALSKITGNISTTRQFLSSVGSGAAAALPTWAALTQSDLPLTIRGIDTTGFKLTRSVAVPASPSIGDIWEELSSVNNSLIMQWAWNGTYWLSLEIFNFSHHAAPNYFIAKTFLAEPFGIGHNLFLLNFNTVSNVGNPNDGTNYYIFNFIRRSLINVTTSITSLTTQSQTVGNNVIAKSTINSHVNISSTDTKAFVISISTVGTPGNLNCEMIATYRLARA